MTTEVSASLAAASLRQLLTSDISLADIFYRYKMDFCCGGHQTLAQAAERAQAPLEQVMEEVETHLRFGSGKHLRAEKWPLHFLVEYIELIHHAYTREALTTIAPALSKILQKHGSNHPELETLAELFVALDEEMQAHMQKEERVLFPYIVRLAQGNAEVPPFGSLQNPIRMMQSEHDDAGRILEQMAEITGQFTPPADGCNTYRFVYRRLQELDEDLRLHIHLENNILFPRALALEEQPGA
ncbi:iron-sulfur cluster repair di-iron protein [Hymenobacter sp. DG25B]|uniref:iron-sulfur cluster repair di-iron protein n=1 Tax=Hymenobacter sp. DG25B TaxID=1385664 RepID=UPI000661FBCC|nr:iron-sulfur cluster repair di-iron protein [Hymenobacter sp. DG25B]